MSALKRKFIQDGEEAQRAVDAVRKKQKLSAKVEKLVGDRKRWLSKLKLAGTKVSKLSVAIRRAELKMEGLR